MLLMTFYAFYQNAEEIFYISREFEFLDKELAEMFPQEDNNSVRYVDKLAKLFLKDGQEKWVLVHVEVLQICTRMVKCYLFCLLRKNIYICLFKS
jgi:hypothetical protein